MNKNKKQGGQGTQGQGRNRGKQGSSGSQDKQGERNSSSSGGGISNRGMDREKEQEDLPDRGSERESGDSER